MRYFNTSGPCHPQKHYTVMRETLVSEGLQRVKQGRYITLFAPRQAGKTTFFQLLLEALRKDGNVVPIWLSFENLKNVSKKLFYEAFSDELCDELETIGIRPPHKIKNEVEFLHFFQVLRSQCPALAIVIDEFEGVPEAVLGELMHTFRKIYHKREKYALHSLTLVGVSTIAELVVSSASPFNIVDELKIPYFSYDEIRGLIRQYIEESGQRFDDAVIKAIHRNTGGQPGLVCALCAHLVEKVAKDRSRPVEMDDFYQTLQYFLTEAFDKNIVNIVQKANEKKAFMLRLLFSSDPIPFTVHDPDIGYLYAHGVVEKIDRQVDINVPLYKKVLLNAFRPAMNGETPYYVTAHDTFSEYVTPDQSGLIIKAILRRYDEYVKKRGFRAFDTEHLKEGAWHYSLDGFIYFFIDRLQGQTFVEVPTGRGRTDILILYRGKKYIIETKIFTDRTYFENGKKQLAEYLKSEGLDTGYYVVFSQKHTEEDVLEQEEQIDGKRIYTRIIRVDFERPSDRK